MAMALFEDGSKVAILANNWGLGLGKQDAEKPLSDVLKSYFDSLPPRVRRLAEEARLLYMIYLEMDEGLRNHVVPTLILEEPAKDREGAKKVLILCADSGTAILSAKSWFFSARTEIQRKLGISIDEARILLKSSEEIAKMRLTLLGEEE